MTCRGMGEELQREISKDREVYKKCYVDHRRLQARLNIAERRSDEATSR
jgi:hypothetical protein